MKRSIALWLTICMALSLAACGAKGGGTEDGGAPTPTPEAEILPRVIVSVEREDSEETAEDGTTLLLYSYCAPTVRVEGGETAAELINNALAQEKLTFEGGNGAEDVFPGREELLSRARQMYADGYLETPFAMERAYLVTRGDDTVLSMVSRDYINAGGAHGSTWSGGLNFDMESGQRLRSVDALAAENVTGEALRQACGEYILKMCTSGVYSDRGFFDGYEDEIPGLTAGTAWALSAEGLVFIANPELLAPYAAGRMEFTVPYDVLAEVLDAKWLPAVYDGGDGDFTGGDSADMKDAALVGSADAAPGDEYARDLTLRAEGNVYSVALDAITYQGDGTVTKDSTWWYCSYMRAGEAVALSAVLPETLPTLMLLFQNADGGAAERWLTESGMDGSLNLYDPNCDT